MSERSNFFVKVGLGYRLDRCKDVCWTLIQLDRAISSGDLVARHRSHRLAQFK